MAVCRSWPYLCLECTHYWMIFTLQVGALECCCENMGFASHLVCVGVTLRAMAWLIDAGLALTLGVCWS
jgi:hypothetical protein